MSRQPGPPTGSPSPQGDPVAAALARLDARDDAEDRDARGQKIGRRRRKLFTTTLANPVAALVEPWVDGWQQFADALGRTADAAAALRTVAALLNQLQSHWESWEAAWRRWCTKEAEPWNAECAHSGCGRFSPDWPVAFSPDWPVADDGEGLWQSRLPWLGGGPKALPDRIVGHHLFRQIEEVERSGLFTDLRAVYAGLIQPKAAHRLMDRLEHPDRVAGVALAVAATILPAPDLLAQLAEGIPTAGVYRDVVLLVGATPDDVSKPLLQEIKKRIGDRFSPKAARLAPMPPSTSATPNGTQQGEGGKTKPNATTEAILPVLLSASDIASRIKKNPKSVTSFLSRFAERNPDCRVEIESKRKNEPGYLYRTADVWPALEKWIKDGAEN